MRASREGGRPAWGQHFLVDLSVAERILDSLAAAPGETVVEIGPGRGALTRLLVGRGIRVLGFEIDRRLAEFLRRELGGFPLALEIADARKADVAEALERLGVTPPVPLVGNLPYESATPLVRAFVRRPDLYRKLVVTLQREVADRIVAKSGARAYGFLSVDVGAHAGARRLFDVPPAAFSPPPRVHSSVVELVPRVPSCGTEGALAVASAGFASRRKTLVNALAPRWGRGRVLSALAALELPPTVRAETLGFEVFRSLAALLGPHPPATIS